MALGEGFMTFARGWNRTCRGWGNDIWGSGQQLWGLASGSDETMWRGYFNDEMGDEQTEQGKNMMAHGINDMLGLVEHGPPAPEELEEALEEAGGGGEGGAGAGSMCSTGGGGGLPEYYDCYTE
jgi:hypothetical protein